MTPGLLLILALLTQPVDEAVSTAPPQPTAEQEANASAGEPLPPGAPTEPYELTAWCYGALGEYLTVYDRVIPDLRDIDSTFGASVHNEAQPYAEDVAAARLALTRFAAALRSAERASPPSRSMAVVPPYRSTRPATRNSVEALASDNALAEHDAAVEAWGERGWAAVGRICRWAEDTGARLPFRCQRPPPDS